MPDLRRQPVYFADLAGPNRIARDGGGGLNSFRYTPTIACLGEWPVDVVEQWPYDHAHHAAFVTDYGHVDLSTLQWSAEVISLEDLMIMSTGASESDLINYFAKDPEHWVQVRNAGHHQGVREMWDIHGTWKRWPILIDRGLVTPGTEGLQVVEGRTRVGVLRGRTRLGLTVALQHLAWVARTRS